MVVLNEKNAEHITRFHTRSAVKTVSAFGRKIKDYVTRNSRDKVSNEDTVMYAISEVGARQHTMARHLGG